VKVLLEEPVPGILADRRKLFQVLRNLLSNAGKFSNPGGTVVLRLQTRDGFARVCVDDEGIGIPPGESEVIFDKFVQASHTSNRSGGTGLGLAICREIIEGHGGRIWAENREGGGARFAFEVPIAGPISLEVEGSDADVAHDPAAEAARRPAA
jgi:signal transduction histidine kinase